MVCRKLTMKPFRESTICRRERKHMSLADWLECLASKPRDPPVSTSLVPIQQAHATSTLESKLWTSHFHWRHRDSWVIPVLCFLRILRVLVRILKLLLLFLCFGFGFCVDLWVSLLCLAGFVAANDLNKNYIEITPTSECLPSAAEPACVERILSDLPQTSLMLHRVSHPHIMA